MQIIHCFVLQVNAVAIIKMTWALLSNVTNCHHWIKFYHLHFCLIKSDLIFESIKTEDWSSLDFYLMHLSKFTSIENFILPYGFDLVTSTMIDEAGDNVEPVTTPFINSTLSHWDNFHTGMTAGFILMTLFQLDWFCNFCFED